MPTGYTANIKNGITFEEFALDCARNFGALIIMRDEPKDAPIPEQFEASKHHEEATSKYLEELNQVFGKEKPPVHGGFPSYLPKID